VKFVVLTLINIINGNGDYVSDNLPIWCSECD